MVCSREGSLPRKLFEFVAGNGAFLQLLLKHTEMCIYATALNVGWNLIHLSIPRLRYVAASFVYFVIF